MATSFNPEFLEKMKKKTEGKWRCPECFIYNDLGLDKCSCCECKKPVEEKKSEKRDFPQVANPEEKKPKMEGFTFNLKSSTPSNSIFSFGSTTFTPPAGGFKFGNTVISLAAPEEKKEEATQTEQPDNATEIECDDDYSKDEKCVDVMEGRREVSFDESVTPFTPIQQSAKKYTLCLWGSGDCGQLGMGEGLFSVGKPAIHQLMTEKGITRVACGSLHNLAVCGDNHQYLYSWGVNDDGALGREGDELVPELVERGEMNEREEVKMIAAGMCNCTVLTTDGTVYCWGSYKDSKGYLGWSKDIKIQKTPKRMEFPDKKVCIATVSCGENHSLAISSKGELYGWGSSEQGQLAIKLPDRFKKDSLKPRRIPFRERKAMKVKMAIAGGMHSLVVLENNHVYMFGLNNWGQLGNGERSEDPVYYEHVPFFDDKEIAQVAIGQHHTIVLTRDGGVYSCGRNSYGQLGRHTKEEYDATFRKVEGFESIRIQQIGCGSCFSFAIDEKGFAYSWGYGDMLQLGNGRYHDETIPYHIKSCVMADKRVAMILGGGQHSAALLERL